MNNPREDITLKQVRSTMESLARKQGCCITAIEIKAVQSELGGSNGTIGAFLKQAKLEHINAMAYDRANISAQLKAAIMEEIDRFADNAREYASEGLDAVQQLNVELSKLNDESNQEILRLNNEVEGTKRRVDDEIRKLSGDVAKWEQKAVSCQGIIEGQKSDIERSRAEQMIASGEVKELTRKVGALEAELGMERNKTNEISAKFDQEAEKRRAAEQRALLAEQSVIHQEQIIKLISKQTENLELQNAELTSQVTSLTETVGKRKRGRGSPDPPSTD